MSEEKPSITKSGRVLSPDYFDALADEAERGYDISKFVERIRVWHDDIRPAPEGWVWVRTNTDAIRVLSENDVHEISLDHDLGLHNYTEAEIEANQELLLGRGQGEETGLDLVKWMIESGYVPQKITIHSWNPDAAMAMAMSLNEAGYDVTIKPFQMPKKP